MSTSRKDNFEKEIFFDAECEKLVDPHESEVISKDLSEDALLEIDFSFPFKNPRKTLPGRVPTQGISIWAILKEFVGRDLTHISMPVIFNEPLSILHKIIEVFSQQSQLVKIMHISDPVESLEYIGAHLAVCQSSLSYRSYKPFNPLLGETYEIVVDKNNCYFLAEQVSHHPPVSAFHLRYKRVVCRGFIEQSIKFWGNSVDIILNDPITFELYDAKGEIENLITLTFPTCSARNIILGVGNIRIERHGLVHIINHTTGHQLNLNFKEKSWFSNRDLNVVEGVIVDKCGKELRCLYGHWTDEIWSCSPETFRRIKVNPNLGKGPDSKLLAKAIPKLPDSEHYFNLPLFSIAINEYQEGMNLPPTDTRLRPDIIALENGDLELASAEKHRLEEKQRAARRLREANGDTWVPLWFELKPNSILNRDEWRFNGKYLEQKFENCPDIY